MRGFFIEKPPDDAKSPRRRIQKCLHFVTSRTSVGALKRPKGLAIANNPRVDSGLFSP